EPGPRAGPPPPPRAHRPPRLTPAAGAPSLAAGAPASQLPTRTRDLPAFAPPVWEKDANPWRDRGPVPRWRQRFGVWRAESPDRRTTSGAGPEGPAPLNSS